MTNNRYFTILILTSALLVMCSRGSFAQVAPVTSLGIVTNAVPGTVIMPVTVTGFNEVGQFNLTFTYETTSLTYISYTAHAGFTNLTISSTVSGSTGTMVISWPGTGANLTLPDASHLVDINFNYLTGTTYLLWNTISPNCQYKTFSGGIYVALSDSPKAKYYLRGGVGNKAAPVVTAPTNSIAGPGSIAVPITVSDFIAIQGFTLELVYDQNVLTYVNCTPNSSLGGSFDAGSIPSGDKKKVSVIWTGLSTLANGSTLFTINFTFSSNNANYSTLNWYDNGPSCVFTSAGEQLIDFPTASYYNNGLVYTQYAAKALLPDVTNPIPFSTLTIPVQTEDFTNISSFTLSFQYDYAVLTYSSFTPKTELSTMTVVNNAPVGSTRTLEISWTGSTPITLTDGSSLADLVFTYNTGSTDLAWVTTDATSCRFNDALGHAYYNLPKASYYINGNIESSPLTVPDVAPLITVAPNIMHGVTVINIAIIVRELNNVNTAGPITVKIIKDSRWDLNETFSSPVWTYTGSDPDYHIFTTNTSAVIPAGSYSDFGFDVTWDAGQTWGVCTITAQISSFSGGEVNNDNNVDAETLNFFIN